MSTIFLLYFIFIPILCFSQKDTSTKSMRFDLGITRDQNINLWPIYKRTISKYETDKQLLFPFYRYYHNIRFGEKRSHLFPIYWSDSSQYGESLRIISTYYPSLFHFSESNKEKTKTFTFLEFAPRINLLEFQKSDDGLVMQNNLLFFLWYKNNQLTKKSYFIVFPAYWQFKTASRSTKLLFPLYYKGNYFNNKYNYTAVTPLFWKYKSPKRSSNLLLPIWWNRKVIGSKDTAKSNLILPIYYSSKDHNTNNKVLFPILWNFRNDRYKSLTLVPFVSYGKSFDFNRNHLVITPFYWRIKNNEKESNTLFPLIWSYSWKFKNEHYSSFVIFPLFWSQINNDDRQQILLPFIWNKTTTDYHSFTFIPLFSFGKSNDLKSGYYAITPIFWHTQSATRTTNKLIPVWWYRKQTVGQDTQIRNVIFPLYWSWKKDSFNGKILFPIVWNLNSSNYQSFTIFPLLTIGNSTDGKKSLKAITPFYWKIKSDKGSAKLLFPLWWQKDRNLDGELRSSSLVILLYWKYLNVEKQYHGIFPFTWRFNSKNIKSYTFLPFYSKGQSTDSIRKYLTITPLFWHLKNEKRSFNTLFPVWWNKNIHTLNQRKKVNIVLPIFYSRKDSLINNKVVFPLVWSLNNPKYNSFTFIPFLSNGHNHYYDRKHLVISPLFWLFQKPEGYSTALFPIFWRSVNNEGIEPSTSTVVFPIFWSINDSRVKNKIIFPFIWSFNNPNYKSFSLVPLFSYGHNENNSNQHYVITPFFWYIKNQNNYNKVLFPLYWSSRKQLKNSYERNNVLFPVYWSLNNSNRNFKSIFPIFWKYKNSKIEMTTIIPLYSSGKTTNGNRYTMITPIYWHLDNNFRKQTILFPLFSNYKDTSNNKKYDILLFLYRHSSTLDSTNTSILWPIIERSYGINYKYFRFAPLVWSKKSPSFSYFTIQPFYYYSNSLGNKTYRILWELYVHRNQPELRKTNSILWKLVTWDRYNNGDKEFRLLHLLYANSNVDGRVEKSIFPIYYLSKDDSGNRSLSVMLYFYNSIKRLIPNTNEYYREERIFWLIRFRSNYWQLKQKRIDIK